MFDMTFARRRLLGASAAALALLATGCATVPASSEATSRTVSIATPDGTTQALLFTPAGSGPWPAVLLFPDVSGLRPVWSDIGAEVAKYGYVVLIPNEFYRSIALDGSAEHAAPVLEGRESFARGQEWRALATDDAVAADTRAYMAYLDTLRSVDHDAKAGVAGYDIGGAHAFIAARTLPDKFAAVAVAHPTAIATARDNSPHLFVDQSKAQYLIEIAGPDDEREPGDKDDLRNAFAAAGLEADVLVIPAEHGYAVADQAGYDAGAAQGLLARMLALFASAVSR